MSEGGGAQAAQCAGIGVTVPGPADTPRGVLVHTPYAGWRDVPAASLLGEHFPGMPVRIANDVNACALVESRLTPERSVGNLLWVTISTGIGGRLVLNGNIYEGEHGIAG